MCYVLYENSPLINVHVDHLKPHEGVCPRSSWLCDDADVESASEPLEDVPERVDCADYSPSASVPDSPIPTRTRTGRVVKPREIYTP